MINLNYLTDHILYPILKVIKRLYHQKHETLTNSRNVYIYIYVYIEIYIIYIHVYICIDR